MSSLERVLLSIRTARHLKPRQLLYLPVRRLQGALSVGGVSAPVAEVAETAVPDLSNLFFRFDPRRAKNAVAAVNGVFEFASRSIDLDAVDWNEEVYSPLWTYNLHYFGFAVDLGFAYVRTRNRVYARRFAELARRWIDATSPNRGVGWDPYPTSVRIVNWLYALQLTGGAIEPADRYAIFRSVAAQAAWLRRRLEYHIDGNHLQKNYFALALAGVHFRGRLAIECKRVGFHGLWESVLAHVLPDGGHCERSPMYHAMALKDFLEAVAWAKATNVDVPDEVMDRIKLMVRALRVFSRPDGSLHLFNDTVNNAAPAISEIEHASIGLHAGRVPRHGGMISLPQSGFYGVDDPNRGVRIVIDGAEPGPDHQPSHSHCGLLSYELDWDGLPLVVDSGVSGYGRDPLRSYFRATRAHNTVSIEAREQSEIWGDFRMARRAKLIRAHARLSNGAFRFSAAYRPYHGLGTHEREVSLRDGVIRVSDLVHGAYDCSIKSFVHFHPAAELKWEGELLVCRRADARDGVIVQATGVDEVTLGMGGAGEIEGWYSERFGCAVAAPVMILTIHRNAGQVFGYEIRPE